MDSYWSCCRCNKIFKNMETGMKEIVADGLYRLCKPCWDEVAPQVWLLLTGGKTKTKG